MNRILYTFLLIASLGILQGCGDFLGNKPKGYTIPEKIEDYSKLLKSSSLMNCLYRDVPSYFTDDIKLLDKNASCTNRNYISKDDDLKNIFSFRPGQIVLPGEKDNTWNMTYDRVFTYNVVINDVMNAKDGSETEKQALKAEALFGRAFEYFYLVNLYGKHYDAATAATDYGIPYLTEADINQKYTRHTVKEVYDFIFRDLEEAGRYLPNTVASKNHPTQNSLYSLYARIYLYMGDYAKALTNANKALELNRELINLNDYEKKEGVTFGRVHIKGDPAQVLPDILSPELNFARYIYSSGVQSSVLLSDELRDLFKKNLSADSKDLRKDFYTAEDFVDMGSLNEFPGECAYVLYGYKNGGLSSVEDLLVAAECEARVGSKDRAMNLINKLRDNRIEGNVALTASSNDDALVKVLEERRREFMFVGAFRLLDLKRLNKEAKFAKDVVHSVDGETWTLPANSLLYVMPVSSEVLTFQPDMPQYDRK